MFSIEYYLFVAEAVPGISPYLHGADLNTLPRKSFLASRLSYLSTSWTPLISATYHFEMLPNPPRFHDTEDYVIEDAGFTNSSQQILQSHLLTKSTTSVAMHSKNSFQPPSKPSKPSLHRSYTS